MTTKYVSSVRGDNSDGSSWSKAYTTLAGAVTAVGTGQGHIIYVDSAHTESVGATTTYTLSAASNNPTRILSCTYPGSDIAPTTLAAGASIDCGAGTNYGLRLAGSMFVYGVTFKGPTGNNGSEGWIRIGSADKSCVWLESCTISELNTNSGTGYFRLGETGDSGSFVSSKNCTWIYSNSTACKIQVLGARWISVGDTFTKTTATPTYLFQITGRAGRKLLIEGADLSDFSGGTLLNGDSISNHVNVFVNCKMPATYTALATQSWEHGGNEALMFNCVPSGGTADTHYHLQHHHYAGSTVIDAGIYATAGAYYTGTTAHSWKIVTTANCSYLSPYVSPWIDCYNEATSSVTPTLEICRDGDTPGAYKNDEVWSEWTFQATSGSPVSTFKSDRRNPLAAAVDQDTGALGNGDWFGEHANSWYGKLDPGSATTPAEIGHVRARVVVGAASATVYVDPKIRGL